MLLCASLRAGLGGTEMAARFIRDFVGAAPLGQLAEDLKVRAIAQRSCMPLPHRSAQFRVVARWGLRLTALSLNRHRCRSVSAHATNRPRTLSILCGGPRSSSIMSAASGQAERGDRKRCWLLARLNSPAAFIEQTHGNGDAACWWLAASSPTPSQKQQLQRAGCRRCSPAGVELIW